MAKKILSVSYLDGTYQFMEVDKQAGGFFPKPVTSSTTVEALVTACRKADEIHISAELSTAVYEWESFPKVAKRFFSNLVQQHAVENIGVAVPLQVQFKHLGDVDEAGASKSRIMYIAVQEADLRPLWTTFNKFIKKVKVIAPLPVAMASVVAQTDKPAEDFIVVWTGEKSSVIAISSPEGMVKMARSVPIGLSREAVSDPEDLGVLSENIGKELFMTTTFFKQEFRSAVPGLIYFLGNNQLERAFMEHPVPGAPADVRFSLSSSPVQGISNDQLNEQIHLIGNLFLPPEFSFIPPETVVARKGDVVFKIAVGLLILGVVASGFWAFALSGVKHNAQAEYDRQTLELKKNQHQVKLLRNDVERLKPIAGWKEFYENTFQKRPAWNMVFSELGLLLPENILIEDLKLESSRKAKAGPSLVTKIKGKIKADNWEQGLEMLREFGASLQASPLFDIANINYSPQDLQKTTKVFDFQIEINLIPRGSAHAS